MSALDGPAAVNGGTTLVVGVGNVHRGDDAVGPLVARALRAMALGGVDVCELSGDLTVLPDAWAGKDRVFLVDAVHGGSAPGTIYRFDARAAPLPNVFVRHISSHGVGLGEAIELAEVLDQLPPHLIVYGVEAADFDPGAELSPVVARAIPQVAQRLLRELHAQAALEEIS